MWQTKGCRLEGRLKRTQIERAAWQSRADMSTWEKKAFEETPMLFELTLMDRTLQIASSLHRLKAKFQIINPSSYAVIAR